MLLEMLRFTPLIAMQGMHPSRTCCSQCCAARDCSQASLSLSISAGGSGAVIMLR
jgi:hypothetical protein